MKNAIEKITGRTVGTINSEYVFVDDLAYPIVQAEILEQAEQLYKDRLLAEEHEAINERVRSKIAERYTIQDEIKLLRTAPSAEFDAYNTYVEECRAWGNEQKLLIAEDKKK